MKKRLTVSKSKGVTLRVQDSEYKFYIHSFMSDNMRLQGKDLLVYALIYSYVENGEPFIVSRSRIARLVGCSSVLSVDRSIESLKQRMLIYEVGEGSRGIKEYAISIEHLPDINAHKRVKEILREDMERVQRRNSALAFSCGRRGTACGG